MMHAPAQGRAGGKVILLGEHVVVYGRPALAAGIPLGVDAVLEEGAGPRLVSDEPDDGRGARLVAGVVREMGLDPTATVVRVRSTLPAGRGLGSSAALSIAVLRAAAAAAGRDLDTADELALGRRFEAIFHGTSSGIDPAAAALGTCFRFVRGEPPIVTPIVPGSRVGLVIAFGGAARSTGAIVDGLRARRQRDADRYERVFDEVAAVVDDGVRALERGDRTALGAAFDRNQELLDVLGVSSPEVETIVRAARRAGARGAKLTGGGGGGAVIAVADDPEGVASRLARTGVETLVVELEHASRAA
jgi:mevalonate kinase